MLVGCIADDLRRQATWPRLLAEIRPGEPPTQSLRSSRYPAFAAWELLQSEISS